MDFSILNELFFAILLGITQGVTEFLPISSTAHLRLLSAILTKGRDIGLSTSNVIQFGTLIAIIQYFWNDLKVYFDRVRQIIVSVEARDEFSRNFQSWWNNYSYQRQIQLQKYKTLEEYKITNDTDLILAQLLIGTLPIILIGFVLRGYATNVRDLTEIAWFLVAGSVLMAGAEYIHRQTTLKPKPTNMTPGEVILIGFFQSLAIFPGISRSGATVSGALMMGRDRAKSVRFSFLLSIPALALAGIADIFTISRDFAAFGASWIPSSATWSTTSVRLSIISLVISFALSYIFGMIFLKWLLKYLSSNTFRNFIIYRVALALVILSFLALAASPLNLFNF